jgi:pimeloyl-ACP methyl ester carboxylesterase
VSSADGTTIGYRQIGSGPGLVLVHGGLMTSSNFRVLAEALSDRFTVSVPDRRGRGLSGRTPPTSGLCTEVDDIRAVVQVTGSDRLFGLSSGAVICLYAALRIPSISQVALYEPPLSTQALAWAPRYDSEVRRGRLADAFISILKGTGDDARLAKLPRFVLRPLIALAIAGQRRQTDDGTSLADLVPTMRLDIAVVADALADPPSPRDLSSEVLLLGGQRSVPYLRATLDHLQATIPQARRIELEGVGHIAADNRVAPKAVAAVLRTFFAAEPS